VAIRALSVAARALGQAEFDLDTLAANIDLGAARVGLVVAKQDLALVGGANGGARDAVGVHVAVPLGAFTVGGSFTNYEVSPAAGGAKPEADVTTVAARYAFSKRTSIVGSYQTVKNSGAAGALAAAAATGINGGAAGSRRGLGVVETTGKTASGIGLTVVHTF
jgi:predicted porin